MTDDFRARLEAAIDRYRQAFPKAPPMNIVRGAAGDRLEAVWIMGNDYSGSGYYGSYPGNYVKRIRAMFPEYDNGRVLHVCSGSITGRETVDVNPDTNPTYCLDAEIMAAVLDINAYDIILIDPPYNKDEATKYGYKMLNRRNVLEQCWFLLKPGGWLLWLDVMAPMYAKKNWNWRLFAPIFTSTNRIIRALFGFEKKGGKDR